MKKDLAVALAHPGGEQPAVEEWSAIADTFGGRVHVRWDAAEPVTPLGQLPFFVEYLKQGGLVGYNPHKPGRPSHCYHTYMMSTLRLVLSVDVQAGDQHNVKHASDGLWSLLDRLGRSRWPALLRGDSQWGNEPVMARAEREGLPYLFRLRATRNVNRALQNAMLERDWTDAGQGWQGKETSLRLMGWSRQRRVILLRRKLDRPLAVIDHTHPALPQLSFAELL